MKARLDILGLGAVAVDECLVVEAYPSADAKTPIVRQERHCGGLAATALAAAAQLGARCAYAGVLGEDERSAIALESLRRQKVDVSLARRVRGARPVCSWIVVGERGTTRNIFYDLSGVVGAGARWPTAAVIRSCRVLLVDHLGVPGMLRAARIAHAKGIAVVGDFDAAEDPQFEELLHATDHLILSQPFAAALTGKRAPPAAVQKLWHADRQAVVVTAGEAGCWYRGLDEEVPRHQPAFAVPVVDTTGCGDVFHGAYAFGLTRGWALPERIRFATGTAALKACSSGGQSGLPSLARVTQFLHRAVPQP